MKNASHVKSIGIIVPAAGKSLRMGKDKRILPFCGMTILEATVRNALDSNSGSVVLVLDSNSYFLKRSLLKSNTNLIVTMLKEDSPSMLHTITKGVEQLPKNIGTISIIPGDCPQIYPTIINKLNKEFLGQDMPLFVPVFKGVQGHPRYLERKMVEDLKNLKEQKFSSIFKMHRERTKYFEVNEPSIVRDVDTFEDYQFLIQHLHKDAK